MSSSVSVSSSVRPLSSSLSFSRSAIANRPISSNSTANSSSLSTTVIRSRPASKSGSRRSRSRSRSRSSVGVSSESKSHSNSKAKGNKKSNTKTPNQPAAPASTSASSVPMPSSLGGLSLLDLRPADKQRIGHLLLELASIKRERDEFEHSTSKQLLEYQAQNASIIRYNEKLKAKFLKAINLLKSMKLRSLQSNYSSANASANGSPEQKSHWNGGGESELELGTDTEMESENGKEEKMPPNKPITPKKDITAAAAAASESDSEYPTPRATQAAPQPTPFAIARAEYQNASQPTQSQSQSQPQPQSESIPPSQTHSPALSSISAHSDTASSTFSLDIADAALLAQMHRKHLRAAKRLNPNAPADQLAPALMEIRKILHGQNSGTENAADAGMSEARSFRTTQPQRFSGYPAGSAGASAASSIAPSESVSAATSAANSPPPHPAVHHPAAASSSASLFIPSLSSQSHPSGTFNSALNPNDSPPQSGSESARSSVSSVFERYKPFFQSQATQTEIKSPEAKSLVAKTKSPGSGNEIECQTESDDSTLTTGNSQRDARTQVTPVRSSARAAQSPAATKIVRSSHRHSPTDSISSVASGSTTDGDLLSALDSQLPEVLQRLNAGRARLRAAEAILNDLDRKSKTKPAPPAQLEDSGSIPLKPSRNEKEGIRMLQIAAQSAVRNERIKEHSKPIAARPNHQSQTKSSVPEAAAHSAPAYSSRVSAARPVVTPSTAADEELEEFDIDSDSLISLLNGSVAAAGSHSLDYSVLSSAAGNDHESFTGKSLFDALEALETLDDD